MATKNFNKSGFTTFGLTNYSFLRNKDISREKSISILTMEDRKRRDASTFRQRYKQRRR